MIGELWNKYKVQWSVAMAVTAMGTLALRVWEISIEGIIGNFAHDAIKALASVINFSVNWESLLIAVLFLASLILSFLGFLQNNDIRRRQEKVNELEGENHHQQEMIAEAEEENFRQAEKNNALEDENRRQAEKIAELEEANRHLDRLTKTGVNLQIAIASMIGGGPTDEIMKKLLTKFLSDSVAIFPNDGARATLYRRDPVQNQLQVWTHWGRSEESVQTEIWPLDHPEAWGTAGQVYTRDLYLIVKLEEGNNGELKANHPSYVEKHTSLDDVEYSSFAAIAVLKAGSKHERCAVLTIDSKHLTTFDDANVKRILHQMALQIAGAIAIYDHLKQQH